MVFGFKRCDFHFRFPRLCFKKKSRFKTIYENDNWKYVWPIGDESFCEIAKGTKWCGEWTKDQNWYQSIGSSGTHYILIDKKIIDHKIELLCDKCQKIFQRQTRMRKESEYAKWKRRPVEHIARISVPPKMVRVLTFYAGWKFA